MRHHALKLLWQIAAILLATPLLATPLSALAASYTAVGANAYVVNTGGTALSPTIHASCAAGNLMLLNTGARGGAETLTVTGWDEIASITTNGSLKLLGRIMQGGDGAPSVDWSGTTAAFAQIMCFSGDVYSPITTINAHTPTTNTGSSAGLSYPALTITTADTLVLIIGRKHKTATGDGITIDAEPGFTEIGESAPASVVNISVWNYVQQTTAASISAGAWAASVAAFEALNDNSLTVSLKTLAASPPSFDSNPVVASQTTTAYTINYDASANAVSLFCGVYAKDATTPTGAQVEAGTGARGTATEATTGSADSIVLTPTDSPVFPLYDLYCVLENASGYSAVVGMLDEVLDLAAGKQQLTLTSVHATSPYTGSAVAAGDICTIDTVTTPTAYVVTDEADGTVSYAAGGDNSRQIITSACYDVSAIALLDFTLVYNNRTCEDNQPLFGGESFLYRKSVAITALDIKALCVDPEGDTVTAIATSALPAGLSIAAGSVTGTPTTCGNTNTGFQWSDLYAATYAESTTFAIGDLVPNVVNVLEATAISTIEAVCSLDAVSGGSVPHGTIASGNVVSISPVASTLVAPTQQVTYDVSSGLTGLSYVGGKAFDSSGRLFTLYLNDATAVPATAAFIGGTAFEASSGAQYVCLWPADGIVAYISGIALRDDGCMTIIRVSGTVYQNAVWLSSRGEVSVTEVVPTSTANLYGFVANQLSVTDSGP